MTVLTISGQSGAGAQEIGRLVAARLELEYIDQEILVEAARALGVPMESVVTHDERAAGMGERLANMLRRFLERSAAAGAADPMLGGSGLDVVLGRSYIDAAAGEGLPEVSDDAYIGALTDIIRDLADHDDVLIIGRGSQVILQDWPGAIHVLAVAPENERIAYRARVDNLDDEEAAKRVHDREKGRVGFHEKFFNVNVNDASLYHLTVNTGRLSHEGTADLIAEAARRFAAG